MDLSNQEKLEIAQRGIYFEELRKHPAMELLLDTLQHRAELAREALCDIPAHHSEKIAEQQYEVWKFRELVKIINGFISEGNAVEQQLAEEDQMGEYQ